ncbi:MAG: hypothetical protein R3D71_09135 [Rickettsiales bacterium]
MLRKQGKIMEYYYISSRNEKDGPHDIITIMRRIRTGAITTETIFYHNNTTIKAGDIEEFNSFFNHPVDDIRNELTKTPSISIKKTLRKGWNFVAEHQGMSAFAGAILLFSVLCAVLTHALMNNIASAITAGWIVFALLQGSFLLFAICLYRGQRTSVDFIEHTIAPVMGKVALASILMSFAGIIGLPLLIPSLAALLIAIFIPIFMLDYNYGIGRSIKEIIKIFRKLDTESLIKILLLLGIYMVSVVLIFPIPVTMSIMAGGACYVYDELTSI